MPSNNHGADGQNALYLDGRVRWVETTAAGVNADDIYLAANVQNYDGDEVPSGPTDSFLLPAWTAPDSRR